MGYKEDNIKKLDGGFSQLSLGKDARIERIMYDVLDKALDVLLEAHDDKDNKAGKGMHHANESDTLGWALIHNGSVVEAVSQLRGKLTDASALNTLQELVKKCPKQGWCGIVCSDMVNGWYRVDWEIDFLNQSAESVISNMHKHFHKL